jgi:hypothetical protein
LIIADDPEPHDHAADRLTAAANEKYRIADREDGPREPEAQYLLDEDLPERDPCSRARRAHQERADRCQYKQIA